MEQGKGTCSKHGEFVLAEGCEQCLKARQNDRSPDELEEGLAQEGLELVREDALTKEPTALTLVNPQQDTAIQKIYTEAKSLLAWAQARNIITIEDAGKATEDGAIITKLNKELESKRKEYIQPFRNHIDEVNEAFKILAAPLKEAKQITDNKIMAFNKLQREIQQKQEEINRLRMEAAQKEAEMNNGEISESVNLVEVIEAPKAIVTNLGTAGERLTWTYEITDFALLPDMYKTENATLIKATIVGSNGKTVIPGVRAFQKSSLTYR